MVVWAFEGKLVMGSSVRRRRPRLLDLGAFRALKTGRQVGSRICRDMKAVPSLSQPWITNTSTLHSHSPSYE